MFITGFQKDVTLQDLRCRLQLLSPAAGEQPARSLTTASTFGVLRCGCTGREFSATRVNEHTDLLALSLHMPMERSLVTSAKELLKRALPATVWDTLRTTFRGPGRLTLSRPHWPPADIYRRLYQHHIRNLSDADIVGEGRLFDLIGRIEHGVLLMEGLRPDHTLLDFGCGTGRLAVHVIPTLVGGHYIGVELLDSIVEKARRKVGEVAPHPPCRVTWVRQDTDLFPFADASVDVLCAFSVFTHMEHEDTFRYLKGARRIVRPSGRLVYSCLPMKHQAVYDIFTQSASHDFRNRWRDVRNVTTSEDLMDAIARLAGWTPIRWYQGNQNNIRLPDTGELAALGQSVCVLVPQS